MKWLKEAKSQVQSCHRGNDGRSGRFEVPKRTHLYSRINVCIIINSPQMLKNNKILGTAMWGKPLLPTVNLMRLKWYSRKDVSKHSLNTKKTKLINIHILNTKIE